MNENKIKAFILENRGKILGGVIGLVASVLLLTFGFFKSLFIVAVVIIGVYFGSDKDNWTRVKDFTNELFGNGKR